MSAPHSGPFYSPSDAWFGDVMPIVEDGTVHLFYARLDRTEVDTAIDHLRPLDWGHITTRDFASFEEHPVAIRHGDADSADYLVGAGSIVRAPGGQYVAYYCGINPRRSTVGEPEQVVLRATSDDLFRWVKDEDFVLEADPEIYDRHNWRDPFVWQDDGGRWLMLLCTRRTTGAPDRRGVVGLASSRDLVRWDVDAPLLSPGSTFAPECPEIFELEGVRYLLYSAYSDRFTTVYRLGGATSTPIGVREWTRPRHDALESNDVYASNTVAVGDHSYLIGWLATRSGDTDTGHRQWGGDMVVHQLHQRADLTLGVAPVPALVERLAPSIPPLLVREGSAVIRGDGDVEVGGAGFSWVSAGQVGGSSYFEVTVDLGATAEEFGVALRADANFARAYLLRVEPQHRRVVFDRRPHRIDVPFEHNSDRGYVSSPDFEIERPIVAPDSMLRIRVLLASSGITCYLNDVALSTRGYDLTGGLFGLYAASGTAGFSGIRLATL